MRIVVAPDGWRHLRLLRELALLPHVLPESAAQVGVLQSAPHYQDVFDHSRSVLAHLAGLFALIWPDGPYSAPEAVDGDDDGDAPARGSGARSPRSSQPLPADLQRHLRCRWLPGARAATCCAGRRWRTTGASRPSAPSRRRAACASSITTIGARCWPRPGCGSLKFSGDEIAYVARLTDLHMRPGELAHEYPFTRRARVPLLPGCRQHRARRRPAQPGRSYGNPRPRLPEAGQVEEERG